MFSKFIKKIGSPVYIKCFYNISLKILCYGNYQKSAIIILCISLKKHILRNHVIILCTSEVSYLRMIYLK